MLKIILQFFFLFGSHPAMHRGYSWLCTQELPLAVLRGPYGMLGIEPGSAACKANTLPAVLLLQPLTWLEFNCSISDVQEKKTYLEQGGKRMF